MDPEQFQKWREITGGDAGKRLTVLDYFAGQALAGLLANPNWVLTQKTAECAYKNAEAMLAERARRSGEGA